jgi:hypothetical protein
MGYRERERTASASPWAGKTTEYKTRIQNNTKILQITARHPKPLIHQVLVDSHV